MNTSQPHAFVNTRLSIMMFLQFFIWGAWYVTVGNFMKTHGMGDVIYWAYTVGPLAAIVSPFFLGMVADRFFPTERVLGVMHLLGGLAMILTPMAAEAGSGWFIVALAAHMLCYMPTIGLTNTLAFHNIENQNRFPIIRVFGTIGWIAANLVVSKWLHADTEVVQFYVTAGACFGLGVLSFGLPHTPPTARGKRIRISEILGFDAIKQLSSIPFWVFLISSFLICIPLSAYYAYAPVYADDAGFQNPAFSMSFGQVSEVFFMFLMPLCLAAIGIKWMLLVGMAAWVIRYGLFAYAAEPGLMAPIMIGIVLHGICYDFFFVTGYIYTDKKASPEVRGQAQGLLVLVTLGLGMFIGALISGWLFNGLVEGEGDALRASYRWFWLVPCIAAGVVMVLFAGLFSDRGVVAKD